MAPPAGTLRVGRYFLVLVALFVLLYAIVFWPGQKHTPKLGIDLAGGIRLIYTAQSLKGEPAPTSAQMSQARQILEDRANGTGVTGATVQVQGSDQLLVQIPSGTNKDVSQLGKAAVLNFRGLIAPAVQVSCVAAGGTASAPATGSAAPSGSGTPSTSGAPSSPSTTKPSGTASAKAQPKTGSTSAAPNDAGAQRLPAAAPTSAVSKSAAPTSATAKPAASTSAATPSGSTTVKPSGTPGGSSTPTTAPSSPAAPQPCLKDPLAQLKKADPSLKIPTTDTEYEALTQQQQQELQAALQLTACSAAGDVPDTTKTPTLIACDDPAQVKQNNGAQFAYLLGPIIVPGRQIDGASAQAPGSNSGSFSGNWSVSLSLKGKGGKAWASYTGSHNVNGSSANGGGATACGTSTGTPCADVVAFTLDGQVISAPTNQSAIPAGTDTQITGSYNQSSANNLADQLKYGALPLTFRNDTNEQVSATLGTSQLKAAFLAGGIGLALVVLYSLLYYRGLGVITIASLIVSGGLTYALLVILGKQLSYSLDLAGIAGFIVALGITADSFVVFFERIKDEVHEGRSMRVAVPRAWVRARRTILSADTVSFLAAAVLYYFASADVKGFAFTLGLSTILDLVVVFLFTHPIVSLLSRSATFGSARFTGLNSVRVGGIVDPPPEPPRRSGRARPARASARRGTVLLEKDTDVEADVDQHDDGEPADAEPIDASDVPTATGDSGPPEADEPGGPRRRTTPAAGTAAERAAARRARLREQREKGDG